MTPLEDMEIVAARDVREGDIILDGMNKPFTERPVLDVKTPLTEPMVRDVFIGIDPEHPDLIRQYSIDDYVSIVPRNQLAFRAAAYAAMHDANEEAAA